MEPSVLVQTAEVMIQIVFWMSIVFMGGVCFYWPWWQTALGWTIWLETLGLAWFTLPSALELEFGMNADTVTWQWVALAGLCFVVVILPWRAVAIWRRQRYIENNKEEKK